uniref:Uncharacterized protein n=1 Tax=Solanum lycopersicum TaxID=4081 RepID=A0A3Q7FMR2_SOLLC
MTDALGEIRALESAMRDRVQYEEADDCETSVGGWTSIRLLSRILRIYAPVTFVNDQRGGGGNGGDFVAGFLLGGAIFGTLGYIFAPQIRRSLLNEDEYGFRKAKRPMYYYDEGLEKTRQTLNNKLDQLNSAIDKVSSGLRGGNKMPSVPVESDAEEATM